MSLVFNYNDAQNYKKWADTPKNRSFINLETDLILSMLKPIRGSRILDIGCGTGTFIEPLADAGLDVYGIEPSDYMLEIAEKNLKSKAEIQKGFAENIPFDDNSFEYSCLINVLEFAENPEKALKEACRVTKDRIFIGVINSISIYAIIRRIKGFFSDSIYNRAKIFNVLELRHKVKSSVGNVPLNWQTISLIPANICKTELNIRENWIKKSPFGAFIGMCVIPLPQFRTRPLQLRYPRFAGAKQAEA